MAHFVRTLAVDPANPRRLYAGVLNGRLLESVDAGRTWHLVRDRDERLQPSSYLTDRGEPDKARDVCALHVTQDDQILVGTLGRAVFSWTEDRDWYDLKWDFAEDLGARQVIAGGQGESVIYAGTTEGLFRIERAAPSSDSWQRLPPWPDSGPLSQRVQRLFVSPEAVPRIYVGTEAGFYYSLDDGESWDRAVDGIDREVYVVAMAVDPDDHDQIVLGDWERYIYRSSDGGKTWQRSAQQFDSVVEALLFSPFTSGLIYGITYAGELWSSTDGGAAWKLEERLGVPILSMVQTGEGRLVAGTDGEGVLVRDDDGTWSPAVMPAVLLTVQSMLSTEAGWLAGTGCCGVLRQSSDGEWQTWNQGLPLQARNVQGLVAWAAEAGARETIYAGTYGSGVYARAPDAERWRPLNEGLSTAARKVNAIALFGTGQARALFAGTDAGLYRLRDQVWEPIAPDKLAGAVTQLAWDPATETAFVAPWGGQLYLGSNGGTSWTLDQESPKGISRLALSHATPLERLVLGVKWTLFVQTLGGDLLYRTSKASSEWLPVEGIERVEGERTAIWSYPYHNGGFLLTRTTTKDKNLEQRLPPSSTTSLEFLRAEWAPDTLPVDAGISYLAADPSDGRTLHLGSANQGLFTAQVEVPTLWQQIPPDSWIKQIGVPAAVGLLVLVLAALVLWYILSRRPAPIELEIEVANAAQAGAYRVRVTGAAESEDEAVSQLPMPRDEYLAWCKSVFGPDPAVESGDPVRTVGESLFRFLFDAPETGGIYAGAKRQARRPKVRLRLDLVEELTDLPWELLYDPTEGQGQFLALSERFSIKRRVGTDVRADSPQRLRSLSLLAVTASPVDRPLPGLDEEVQVVADELDLSARDRRSGLLLQAEQQVLLHKLSDPDYRLFHFAGHAEKSTLILVDDEEFESPLDVTRLNEKLDGTGLVLAFLNACDTSGGDGRTPGVARVFANKGVSLVISMQQPVPNAAAHVLVRTFYRALVDISSVEDALSLARRAVFDAQKGVLTPHWAIPVLFARGSTDLLGWVQRLRLRAKRVLRQFRARSRKTE